MEQSNQRRTQSRESGPSGLERVRRAAKGDRKLRFSALLHHVTVDLLRSSYYKLKRGAAPGVDGVTWQEYGRDLEARLSDLHGRIHSGAYRARPSRRVWIPKADGRQRPLGIASLEDKIVQQAVGTVLHQIWEEDFLGFSYGFRPGLKCAVLSRVLCKRRLRAGIRSLFESRFFSVSGFFPNSMFRHRPGRSFALRGRRPSV
jgi:hypothetical protein